MEKIKYQEKKGNHFVPHDTGSDQHFNDIVMQKVNTYYSKSGK